MLVSFCVVELQLSPDNSNPRKLELCANLKQNRFPMDFRHIFTVILPSVTDHVLSPQKVGKQQCTGVRNIEF